MLACLLCGYGLQVYQFDGWFRQNPERGDLEQFQQIKPVAVGHGRAEIMRPQTHPTTLWV